MVEGRNQHSSPRANLPEPSRARDQAAALCGVSPRSVERASKVKARGAPALVDRRGRLYGRSTASAFRTR